MLGAPRTVGHRPEQQRWIAEVIAEPIAEGRKGVGVTDRGHAP
jgi:hypothetical protein